MEYKQYLQSEHWQTVRERFYKSKLKKNCFICHSYKDRNLHHMTYKKIGKENLHDLIVLCQKHHFLIHDYVNTAKSLGLTRVSKRNVLKKYKERLKKDLPPPIKEWSMSVNARKIHKLSLIIKIS